jgi:hypothetical protein
MIASAGEALEIGGFAGILAFTKRRRALASTGEKSVIFANSE